jgi:hypothetical protein
MNVAGTSAADQNTITWIFNGDKTKIDGFRIYRADITNGGSFVPLPDLVPADSSPSNQFSYIDAITPSCGRAYYVVTVYTDNEGIQKETTASGTSWYSPACA